MQYQDKTPLTSVGSTKKDETMSSSAPPRPSELRGYRDHATKSSISSTSVKKRGEVVFQGDCPELKVEILMACEQEERARKNKGSTAKTCAGEKTPNPENAALNPGKFPLSESGSCYSRLRA